VGDLGANFVAIYRLRRTIGFDQFVGKSVFFGLQRLIRRFLGKRGKPCRRKRRGLGPLCESGEAARRFAGAAVVATPQRAEVRRPQRRRQQLRKLDSQLAST
jgi:hypothetical protein